MVEMAVLEVRLALLKSIAGQAGSATNALNLAQAYAHVTAPGGLAQDSRRVRLPPPGT